jgi:hypothetical protein
MGSIPLPQGRPSRFSCAATGSTEAVSLAAQQRDRYRARSVRFRTFVRCGRAGRGARTRSHRNRAARLPLMAARICAPMPRRRGRVRSRRPPLGRTTVAYAEVPPPRAEDRLGSLGACGAISVVFNSASPRRRERRESQSSRHLRTRGLCARDIGCARRSGTRKRQCFLRRAVRQRFRANQDYPGQFGAHISGDAHFFEPFGANRVSPFAYVDRDNCFDG